MTVAAPDPPSADDPFGEHPTSPPFDMATAMRREVMLDPDITQDEATGRAWLAYAATLITTPQQQHRAA